MRFLLGIRSIVLHFFEMFKRLVVNFTKAGIYGSILVAVVGGLLAMESSQMYYGHHSVLDQLSVQSASLSDFCVFEL